MGSVVGTRKPCQVVVCDDQAAFRQLVSVVLNLDPDVEVVGEARDGREAIVITQDLRPDVLVLDISMPVMDGLEALPLIRASSPDTQVVMLTGVVSESVRQRAFAGGVARFIEKGIDVEELVLQVKDACPKPPSLSD